MANDKSRIRFTTRGVSPCKGCPDRYPACSDHCKKPEYLKWCAEKELIDKNRKAYNKELWAHTETTIKRFKRK